MEEKDNLLVYSLGHSDLYYAVTVFLRSMRFWIWLIDFEWFWMISALNQRSKNQTKSLQEFKTRSLLLEIIRTNLKHILLLVFKVVWFLKFTNLQFLVMFTSLLLLFFSISCFHSHFDFFFKKLFWSTTINKVHQKKHGSKKFCK